MESYSWPAVALIVVGIIAKTLDNMLERRRERRKEQDKAAAAESPIQKTLLERVEFLEEKADEYRMEKEAALDAKEVALNAKRIADNAQKLAEDTLILERREHAYFLRHYDRCVNAVQWLLAENYLMHRERGTTPERSFEDLIDRGKQ